MEVGGQVSSISIRDFLRIDILSGSSSQFMGFHLILHKVPACGHYPLYAGSEGHLDEMVGDVAHVLPLLCPN